MELYIYSYMLYMSHVQQQLHEMGNGEHCSLRALRVVNNGDKFHPRISTNLLNALNCVVRFYVLFVCFDSHMRISY